VVDPAGPRPGSAAWWTRRSLDADRPRRRRVDGLTLDRILDAALEIVDAEGLDRLTMRRLAACLNCGHASLYRHVASHDEVLVLLVDRVLGEPILAPADEGTPRHRAECALRRYRALLLEHPALTPAFLDGQLLGPNALARREEALALLLDAHVPTPLAVRAYLTLTHFVISSAAFEASGAGRTAQDRREMEQYFSSLPDGEHPVLRAVAVELNAVDGDDEFELGLHALLDHMERLAADVATDVALEAQAAALDGVGLSPKR
jgi:AcrR family transcriptional regulator